MPWHDSSNGLRGLLSVVRPQYLIKDWSRMNEKGRGEETELEKQDSRLDFPMQ